MSSRRGGGRVQFGTATCATDDAEGTPAIRDLRTLIPYLRRHRLVIALSFLFLFLSEGLALYTTVILRRAVDSLEPESTSTAGLGTYALMILGIVVFQGGARFGSRYLMGYSSRHVEFEVRNDFFSHLLKLEAAYFVRQNVGDLMSRAINDLNAVRMMLGGTLMSASTSVVRAPIAITFLCIINWRLTVFTLIPFAMLPFVMKRLSVRIHKMFEGIQEQFGVMTSKVRDSFTGVRVIRAYVREEDEVRDFERMNDEFVDRNRRLIRVEAIMSQMIFFLPGVSFLFLLWFGGFSVARDTMSFGQFTQFQVVLLMLVFPMASFGFTWAGMQRGAASMGRLNEIVRTEPAIQDEPSATVPETPIRGEVEFRNLNFAYDSDPVLEDVDLLIRAGTSVAIVGATGSGKSTLVSLLPRLYDAEPGAVLVDGRDVREYPLAYLRANIGFVQQESFLFSETMRDNVLFGHPQADDRSLQDVTRVAGLLPEIEDFPSGFSTALGERGVTISGGQRQRASIARSLVGRPRIVILDDAFASVDTYTEESILTNLQEYLAGVTVILISHRVSTARHADKIVVLARGRIAEQGTHDELTARGELYAELSEKQRLRDELESWDES